MRRAAAGATGLGPWIAADDLAAAARTGAMARASPARVDARVRVDDEPVQDAGVLCLPDAGARRSRRPASPSRTTKLSAAGCAVQWAQSAVRSCRSTSRSVDGQLVEASVARRAAPAGSAGSRSAVTLDVTG